MTNTIEKIYELFLTKSGYELRNVSDGLVIEKRFVKKDEI